MSIVLAGTTISNDEGLLKMLQQFRTFGLCFIHNTPASEEVTFDIVRRVGPLRRTYYGDVWSMVAGNMSVGYVCVCGAVCCIFLTRSECFTVQIKN